MTEKESLLVLNQEIKSDLSFCRDCAVSQGATGWVKDFDRLLDKNGILNNKLKQQFSSRSKLSIPKKIAEELEELTGKTNWESTPYSVIEEKGKINTWAYLGHGKCSEQLYKFCRDNTRLMHAYLNPLTRPFVEVTNE